MKILVGADGSDGSWEALRQATSLASAEQDRIVLYYAPPRVIVATRKSTPHDSTEHVRLSLANALFDEARRRLPARLASGLEAILGTGDPREELKRIADDREVDLIAVGARGLGPIRSLLLGSVSLALARHARQAVLIARPKPARTDAAFRVLLPLDRIPPSAAMIELLRELSWPAECRARLMHVVESLFTAELPPWLVAQADYANTEQVAQAYHQEMEAVKQQQLVALTSLRAQLPAAFAAETPLVAEGYPAEQILQVATSEDADLLIMGRRDMSGFERFMLGSTAERVAMHAPCSILLVQHGDAT